jgi:hypothetical protein
MTSPPLAHLPEEIRMNFDRELVGINVIAQCKIFGVVSLATLLDWRIHYALPIYKVGGVWVASRAELKEWKRQHLYLTDAPNIIQKIEKNPPRAKLWRFF